jgi:cell division protein FtsQ
MTEITVSSREEFEERRRRLRWKKRWRMVKLLWRSLLVSGLTGGMLWFIFHSNWILRGAEQIEIEGMQLLSEETVQSLLPLSYPKLIFEVDPDDIAQKLQEHGPIDTVDVQRRLFPPRISIHITERQPVALLLGETYTNPFSNESTASNPDVRQRASIPSTLVPTGLLDANGSWLPLTSYTNMNQDIDLPELRVIGMQASYRQSWETLYETLRQSPIEVYEVDWQTPTNLILNTDLGIVHFGPYEQLYFEQQMTLLDRMRNLPEVTDLNNIDYIDLANLDAPLLQFNPAAPQYDQTTLQMPVFEALDETDSENANENTP